MFSSLLQDARDYLLSWLVARTTHTLGKCSSSTFGLGSVYRGLNKGHFVRSSVSLLRKD